MDTKRAQGGGGEAEAETDCLLSGEPDAGLEPGNLRSQLELKADT